MTVTLPSLEKLRPNAAWANLPLFDRSKWKPVRFGDVVENLNETCDAKAVGLDRYIAMEHMEPGSLHIRTWGNVADGTTFNRRCRPGQLLFGKRRAYQRKVAVAEFDAVVSGDIYVFAPNGDRLLPELLPFICLSERFFRHAVGTSAGSLSPRTNWTSLARYEFALPSLDQQCRIAEILWALNKVTERWIHSLNMARQSSAACAAAAYHCVSVIDSGNGVETRRLGDAFKVCTGGTPSRANPTYWGGKVPWIKTGEVNYQDIYDSEEKISELGYQNSAAKLIPGDSVLMALYGQGPTLGRVAHLRIEATVNQACAAILPNPDFNMRFLYHYLAGQYVEIRRLARGASQPNINALIVKDFIVPAPPLTEQDAVAVELDNRLKAQERIVDCIAKNRNLLVTLTDALL